MQKFQTFIRNNASSVLMSLWFAVLIIWWVVIRITLPFTDGQYVAFAATYGTVALFGGVFGLYYAKKWGFLKSFLGKSLTLLAVGLLFTEFGQLTFSYFNAVKHIDIPYPSLADVGFFGAVPLYIGGAYYLSKTVGLAATFKNSSLFKKSLIVIVPIIMIGLTAAVYLLPYQAQGSSALKVFLDFGYPLGQAVYVTIALLMLFSLKGMYGGLMRPRIIWLLVAFLVQYIADFNFLYQGMHDTWINGSYGDVLYLVAYYIMAMSLFMFRSVPQPKPLKPESSQ